MEARERQKVWTDRIDELAADHPEAEALFVSGERAERLSWSDLSRRSAGVAKLLASMGVSQGSVVCLRLPNSCAFVLAALGAWRLGATVLPLRWDMPAPEREQVLALARPTIIISEKGDEKGDLAAAAIEAAAPLDPADLPPPPVASPAWLIASGGSTGAPKLISPEADTALAEPGTMSMRFTGGRSTFADNSDHRHPVHLVCTPLYHTHGFVVLFRSMTEDFRIVLMPKFDATEFLDLVERESVNFCAIVPTMVIRLLREPTIESRDLSSLENVIIGAGAMPDWATRQWIDVVGGDTLKIGYGMSEALTASFISGSEWLKHPGSVGKSLLSDVLVADQDGNPLPPGEVGELFFRPKGGGEHAFRYLGDARIRTLPGGWASVGDLGKVDEEGYMYIVDRRTDMIVSGGANVFVSEVEAAILAHPQVKDCAVIGLIDPDWGRRVHAIVVPRQGGDPRALEEDLRAHCKRLLASYKAPRSMEFVKTLGRSEAGKLNRQELARVRNKESA